MLVETYNPFNNLLLSSLIAAIPIIVFLLCLTIFKMKGIYAALLNLVITFFIAILIFSLPVNEAVGSVVQGIIAVWPIAYIIVMAVWLYKVSVDSGKFDILRASIAGISQDQRLQLLLIGFCFNAFLEGAAGFGVPIAICAVLLVSLGFKPLQAAMLCLIANGASGAFGAIGIPVAVTGTLNLEGGVTAMDVSTMTAFTLPIINFTIPFLLVFLIDGLKGIKETLPAILVVSTTYTVSQAIFTVTLGPELADIIPSLLSLGVLALFLKKWKPKNIFLLNNEEVKIEKHATRDVVKAWSPFYLLSIFILIWSIPQFKNLFAEGGPLAFTKLTFAIPGTSLSSGIEIVSATGTAILLAGLTTIFTTDSYSFGNGFKLLKKTIVEFWIPIVMIAAILGIAKLMTYAGLTSALGEAVATTGNMFPLLSPILGWIGVFMTGSVVNNNTLFAPIQATAGSIIGVDSALLVSSNTAGGVMAKLISPQSIAIATAAVGETGKESELTKMTLKYSIALLAFVCIWTFILSLILH